MSAPVPVPGPDPLLFTATYQTRQFDTTNSPNDVGINGGAHGVLDNMANPPASGIAAEAASLDFAQKVAEGTYEYPAKTPSIGTV